MRAHEAHGDRWLGLMSSWTDRQQRCGGSKEISVSSPRDKDQCWVFWRGVWVPSSRSRREHSKAQAYSQTLWCTWRWQGRRMETECTDTRSALTCPRCPLPQWEIQIPRSLFARNLDMLPLVGIFSRLCDRDVGLQVWPGRQSGLKFNAVVGNSDPVVWGSQTTARWIYCDDHTRLPSSHSTFGAWFDDSLAS